MDPLSALIAGGSSILGGLMNTSSQQAINKANIQESQWAAEGGNLPGLIANAKAAGINPLAVLGQHAPGMIAQVSGDPGTGIAAAGKQIAELKDPHTVAMEKLAEKRAATEIASLDAGITNTAIETATKQVALNQLGADPNLRAPGVGDPPFPIPQANWITNLGSDALSKAVPYLRRGLQSIGGVMRGSDLGSDPMAGQYP